MDRKKVFNVSAASAIAFVLFHGLPAIGQNSDNASLREHVARGNLLMQHHQYSKALEEYEAAKALEPANSIVLHNIAECHNNWGIACFRQKNFDEAIAHFTKTLSLDQRHSQARYNLEICRRSMPKEESPADKTESAPEQAEKKTDKRSKPEESAGKIVITGAIKSAEPAKTESKTLFGSFSGDNSGSSVSNVATYSKSGVDAPAANGAGASGRASVEPDKQPDAPNGSRRTLILVPSSTQPTAVVASPQGSLEDGLSALELKVYGKKQDDLTVIKRLEKLEMETTGQAGSGTISERIQQLRKNIGM